MTITIFGQEIKRTIAEAILEAILDELNRKDGDVELEEGGDAEPPLQDFGGAWDGEPSRCIRELEVA